MLPQYNTLTTSTNKTIYINPNFKRQLATTGEAAAAILQATPGIPRNAHINPLFLERQKQRPTIHMNPAFLLKLHEQEQQRKVQVAVATKLEEVHGNEIPTIRDQTTTTVGVSRKNCTNTIEQRKIICKSKNRLIREPLVKNYQNPVLALKPPIPQSPLLVINRRKLIRKVTLASRADKPISTSIKALKTVAETKSNLTKYKLDNRVIKKKSLLPPTPKIKRTSFVGRYALRRTSLSIGHSLENSKSILNSASSKSLNKKLQLLNINGLLYRSTRNSLKLKDTGNTPSSLGIKPSLSPSQKSTAKLPTKSQQGLTIFVRGTKYVMDSNKFKLTRVATAADQSSLLSPAKSKINKSATALCRQRIDIGGYTYISANSSKNVFIRSTNHLARAYVHNAKHRSLQMLTKRLVKSNVPCPIYQRVGKCAAFERGKCSKVHNKLQVAICSKFLRGECLNSKCLLSHNISLSKMPVCKFFLLGVCVRNDCPYLHKKLSNNAEICIEFLRGFCQLADKCNKRHEFVCPEVERNGPCTTKNCIYCKSKLRKEKQLEKVLEKLQPKKDPNQAADDVSTNNTTTTNVKESLASMRYFVGGSCDVIVEKKDNDVVVHDLEEEVSKKEEKMEHSDIETNDDYVRKSRPKLGALPAFIPL